MSATQAILRSYRAPREVALSNQKADESLALTWLVIACLLFFVARLPGLARIAHLSGDETPFAPLALGTFFGTIFLAPVVFFIIAGVSHLIAKVLGGQGSYQDARIALFWALFAVTPLVLLQGLVKGMIGDGPALMVTSIAAFLGFLHIWLNGLIALEKR
jgi:hypothetical protein